MSNFNFVQLNNEDLEGRNYKRFFDPDAILIMKGDKSTGSAELYQRIKYGDNIAAHMGWDEDRKARIDLYFDSKNDVMMIKERTIGVIQFKINQKRITSAVFARTLHSRMKAEELVVLEYGEDPDGKYIIVAARN